jgi:high affinity sulfate transporter 1
MVEDHRSRMTDNITPAASQTRQKSIAFFGWLAPTIRSVSRTSLTADVIAGLTLAAVAVPEQMATARLVGVPAVVGLYAFVAGALMFALLGMDPRMSVGADSTIAPVIATAALATTAGGSESYGDIVSLLAILVGVAVVASGFLRLGWVSEFLSTPVITGALAGIAVEIAVRQLPAVLGIAGGGSSLVDRLRVVFDELDKTNGWSVAIGGVVFGMIVVAERFSRRFPAALAGVALATIAVACFGLVHHGVVVTGAVRGGLPSFRIPVASWRQVADLIAPVLTITFLCIAQSAATARSVSGGMPATHGFDRDLVALGAGSLVAGLSGSFAVNVSPPRTSVTITAGGRSQLSGIFAASVTAIVVLTATGLLRYLPQAALGAILIYVATRLLKIAEMRAIWRFDRFEFAMCAATLLVVAFVGIEQGIVTAMVLSLAARTRRIARPSDAVLGREIGTDHWIPCDIGRPTEQLPGVIVYMVYAALWYGNADFVRTRIRAILDSLDPPARLLVIDANGMSDLDYTGSVALRSVVDALRSRGVDVAIARSSHALHRNIKHSGLISLIGADHFFSSVEEAVSALT